jgi:hypothetical protein
MYGAVSNKTASIPDIHTSYQRISITFRDLLTGMCARHATRRKCVSVHSYISSVCSPSGRPTWHNYLAGTVMHRRSCLWYERSDSRLVWLLEYSNAGLCSSRLICLTVNTNLVKHVVNMAVAILTTVTCMYSYSGCYAIGIQNFITS